MIKTTNSGNEFMVSINVSNIEPLLTLSFYDGSYELTFTRAEILARTILGVIETTKND